MLRDQINNGIKDAMKSGEKLKLSTLRLVNAAIKNADIEARGGGKGPLDDAALLGLFQKMIKQRQESVELYEKGGRPELAANERGEIEVIQGFLPKQMSDGGSRCRNQGRHRRSGCVLGQGHGQGDRPLYAASTRDRWISERPAAWSKPRFLVNSLRELEFPE
jgi:uncharacterized protein YqeY